MTSPQNASERVPKLPWSRFAVVASIEFLTVMDASVVNIALPEMRDALGLGDAQTSWIVSIYLVTFAGTLLAFGRISDLVGHRTQFLAGTATFTAASLLCGLADERWTLLLGRAVQGLGAAMVMPAALALIMAMFPEGHSRGRAIGLFSGMAGVAAPIGLVLGGLLTSVDWHLIFWINLPIGLAVVLLGLHSLPPSSRSAGRVDASGAAAATGSLMLLIYALVETGITGWTTTSGTVVVAAAVLACLFVWRQRVASDPVIPRALLRNRTTTTGAALFIVVGTLLLSTFFVVTMYLQEVRLYEPAAAALVYLPLPLAMLLGTILAPRALTRMAPGSVLASGLLIQAGGLVALAALTRVNGHVILGFQMPAAAWAFGLGLSVVTSFVVCTSHVPQPLTGAASGLATSAYQGGGAVGLSLVALLAQSVTETADEASSELAALSGQHVALWALAVIALIGAVAAAVLLRHETDSRDLMSATGPSDPQIMPQDL